MENVHPGPAASYRVRLVLIVSTESRLGRLTTPIARDRRTIYTWGGNTDVRPRPSPRMAPPLQAPPHLAAHWRCLHEPKALSGLPQAAELLSARELFWRETKSEG